MTVKEFRQFNKTGAIGHLLEQQHQEEKPVKKTPVPRKEAKQLSQMKLWLKAAGIAFESEYRFDSKRKFRADIALPQLMVLIEYDGIFSAKSRHTSIKGFTRDAEKFNLAATKGWLVLRYVASNHHHLLNDIQKIISNKSV